MRIIIFLLFSSFIIHPAISQTPKKTTSKNDIQNMMSQMTSALNKQIADLEKKIADAKKNKEDPDKIKQMEDGLASLKKQAAQISGVNQNFSNTSDQSFQQTIKGNDNSLPKKDLKRVGNLPKQIFSDQELGGFVKTVFTGIEKKLPANEVSEARKIYDEIKSNYLNDKPKYKISNAFSNAATGCWIYGHWEKAIWLAGKACIDDVTDLYKINNYASYLSMIGCEDAAVPILEWLNQKRPKSAPIMNNLGQAWFGLGEISKAKQFLESAVAVDEYHSLANLTLSKIYKAEGDYMKAMGALKQSIKYCYTPEKEAELEALGGELDDDDIDFDYPMEDDPFGFEPFFTTFPALATSVAEVPAKDAEWDAFFKAATDLEKEYSNKAEVAGESWKKFNIKLADWDFNQPVMKLHRTDAWQKAVRKFPLAIKKKTALTIGEVMSLMANAYHETTTERLNALAKQRAARLKVANTCQEIDAVNNSFMNSANAIINEGLQAMTQVYHQHKKEVQNYIKLTAYGQLTDYGERLHQFQKEFWQKNQWIYTYQQGFVGAFRALRDRPNHPHPDCDNTKAPQTSWSLPRLKTPDCPHSTNIKLPVGSIKEKCNTIEIDESKLKYKNDNSQKGEIKVTAGDPFEISDDGVELTVGEIFEIVEADVSTGRKLSLEIGEIRMPTQSKLSLEQLEVIFNPASPSNSSTSLQFDAGGNVMINTSRMRTFF